MSVLMVDSGKQIKIGAVLSYFSIVLNVLSGLLLTPWIISEIGPSEYGLYTLANSLIALFLIDFGLGSATARFLSRYVADGKTEKVNSFLGLVYKLYVAVDALILVFFVAVYFLMESLYSGFSASELFQLRVVYAVAALFSLVNFPFITLNGVLTAHERFIHLKMADVVQRAFFVVSTLVVLGFGGGLYGLVAVNALSGLLATTYKLLAVQSTTPVKIDFRYWDKSLCREVFGFSAWSTLASLAQRLIFNITPSILGAFANAAAIAVFGIVMTIEGYVYLLTSAINNLFLPRVSGLCASDDPSEKIMPLMLSVGAFQFAINGLIVAGFALVGRDFILLWMGSSFEMAYYGILLVITPGLFLNPLQIGNTVMVVTKRVNIYAVIILATGIINVVFSVPLSRELGVIGACVSIAVAYVVRAIVLNLFYWKGLGLDMPRFVRECYLKMSLPMVTTLIIGFFLCSTMPTPSWLAFALKAALITVVYLLALLLISKEIRASVCFKGKVRFQGDSDNKGEKE